MGGNFKSSRLGLSKGKEKTFQFNKENLDMMIEEEGLDDFDDTSFDDINNRDKLDIQKGKSYNQ